MGNLTGKVAFAQSSEDQAIGARLAQFQLFDSHVYEVVFTEPAL